MAAYDYRADDGETVELRFPIGEAPDETTLEDGRTAKRMLTWGTGYVLRGKGWASKPERDAANFKKGPQPKRRK